MHFSGVKLRLTFNGTDLHIRPDSRRSTRANLCLTAVPRSGLDQNLSLSFSLSLSLSLSFVGWLQRMTSALSLYSPLRVLAGRPRQS